MTEQEARENQCAQSAIFAIDIPVYSTIVYEMGNVNAKSSFSLSTTCYCGLGCIALVEGGGGAGYFYGLSSSKMFALERWSLFCEVLGREWSERKELQGSVS